MKQIIKPETEIEQLEQMIKEIKDTNSNTYEDYYLIEYITEKITELKTKIIK